VLRAEPQRGNPIGATVETLARAATIPVVVVK
jgi:hypothetical protein